MASDVWEPQQSKLNQRDVDPQAIPLSAARHDANDAYALLSVSAYTR